MSEVALRASGLRKEYGEDGVVDGVDLDVRDGEILVLMGPNGVGKTVLLSCLSGGERPTAGEVEIFDTPIAEDRGDRYAVMFQDSMAVDSLTGRENAAFYASLHPRFTDRWERYVEALDLAGDLDKRVEHYSGGMRRKLELSLVTSLDVPVYLLDEPTAGVDLSMIRQFHDVILGRYRDGASMVISSHRPMDADLADRIAFMPDGRISAVGTPDDLMATVPTTVRVTGTAAMATAADHLLDGTIFPLGGEARGFLPAETTAEDLRAALADAGHGDATVEAMHPTYTDLFNYYVHVRPNEQP